MSRSAAALVLLAVMLGLSACGTLQHRESQGSWCRDETRCPYEAR